MAITSIEDGKNELLYRMCDAAASLNIPTSEVERLIATRKLKAIKINGRTRILRADLLRYIQIKENPLTQAEKLVFARQQAGLTPEELSELSGYDVEVIKSGESGMQLQRRTFAALVAAAVFAGLAGKEQALQEAIAV